MCAAGEYHYGGLHVLAPLQQVQQLAFGLFEAGGGDVGRQHRRRDFQQDHQWVAALDAGLLEALPTRAEQRDDRQQPGEPQHQPGQATVAQPAAGQQGRVKGFRQQPLPPADLQLPMPEAPEQPGQQRHDGQPPGAKQVGQQLAHRRCSRRHARRCSCALQRLAATISRLISSAALRGQM